MLEVSLEETPGVWRSMKPTRIRPKSEYPGETQAFALSDGQSLDRRFDLRGLYPLLPVGRYRLIARIPDGSFSKEDTIREEGESAHEWVESEAVYVRIISDPRTVRREDGVRFVRLGNCSGGHVETVTGGTCQRCGAESRSKVRILCSPCAGELEICGFCARRTKP